MHWKYCFLQDMGIAGKVSIYCPLLIALKEVLSYLQLSNLSQTNWMNLKSHIGQTR